jgi:hypothetical protein
VRRHVAHIGVLVVLALCVPAALAEEPELLAENAGGILELEGENRLEIVGLRGNIRVRQGKSGELRYAVRDFEDRTEERSVALWVEGSVLRIQPLDTAADEPLRLEVSVGPDLAPWLRVSDSSVQLAALYGDVHVEGQRLELTGRMIDGSLSLEISESTASVVSVTRGLDVKGDQLDLTLEQISGELSLDVEGGKVALYSIHGETEATLEAVDLNTHTMSGEVRLDAQGGTINLVDCRAGADLRLSEASLQLSATKGELRVETDGEVKFTGHDGPLTIRGRAGAIIGSQAKGGAMEIEASGAEVRLENCEGATSIRGDSLEIHVTGGKGDLTVNTAYSSIVVEQPEKSVTVENDFGDVEVRGAGQLVQVTSRDGDVRLEEMKGPVKVKADGNEVSAQWANLEGQEISTLENERGDVRVTLPGNLRCRIDAEAPHGRVESDLEGLRVSDDEHQATGVLTAGRGAAPYVKKPTLRIRSSGNVYLVTAGP